MSMGSRAVNSEQVMQATMDSIKLRDAIKGLHHYYLRENAISLKEARPFFWANQDGFTGITLNGIDFNNQPARISVTALTKENGITDLIYCEYDNRQTFPKKSIAAECDSPKVLANNIKTIDITYFGWTSLNALYDNPVVSAISMANKKGWAKEWDGAKRGLLPQYISISIGYAEGGMPYQPTQLWFHLTDADPLQFSVNAASNKNY